MYGSTRPGATTGSPKAISEAPEGPDSLLCSQGRQQDTLQEQMPSQHSTMRAAVPMVSGAHARRRPVVPHHGSNLRAQIALQQ